MMQRRSSAAWEAAACRPAGDISGGAAARRWRRPGPSTSPPACASPPPKRIFESWEGGSQSQDNKAHKTRLASKASQHGHKTSRTTDKGQIVKPNQCNVVKSARAARIQRSKMVQDQKRTGCFTKGESNSREGHQALPVLL